ncbi:hypothetical protein [Tannockella kyphosi]|uniref:hypothetical protein n=1 Tax=Tannockella kyphosi TaxID=2899121 RepID=UPI002011B938|nr:hypothetical protein [Tannockella kyphosi]
MNVRDIKDKVNSLNSNSKMLLFKVMLVLVLIISLKDELVGSSAVLALLCSVLFLTFNHGSIVCSLKILNNREEEFDFPKEIFVGFTRIKELFSTYLVYNVIQYAVTCFMLIVIAMLTIGDFVYLLELYVGTTTYSVDTLDSLISSFIVFFILFGFLWMAFLTYWELNFGFTFFALERYDVKGIAAMKRSKQLLEGYKMIYLKLLLSFLLKIVGFVFISAIIATMLSSLASIVSILISIALVYFVSVDMMLCRTVLFEEMCISFHEKGAVE